MGYANRFIPLAALKRFKLILPPYVLRIARTNQSINRAVKFSGCCLQNCGRENSEALIVHGRKRSSNASESN